VSRAAILVRHGHDVSEPSGARGLSPRGIEQIRRVAVQLHRWVEPASARMWVSPALRARQSAAALSSILAVGQLEVVDALDPEVADGGWLGRCVQHGLRIEGTLIVVGHSPSLEACALHLLGGDPERVAERMIGQGEAIVVSDACTTAWVVGATGGRPFRCGRAAAAASSDAHRPAR
jgi:phosphohistidine phosphatase SixA